MSALGARLQVAALVVRGTHTQAQWARLLRHLARTMGMTPVRRPACWTYPIGGKGGVGVTLVQPITESFLALDVWPAHGGAYLVVASCRPFRLGTVRRCLRAAGLTVGVDPITEAREATLVLARPSRRRARLFPVHGDIVDA